jgi:hypothetical protein
MLLAIDPGVNSPGIALFSGAKLSLAVRIIATANSRCQEDGMRWHLVAKQIVSWVGDNEIVSVVFERPQWYARAKSKGDPTELAGIAGVAANVCGMLSPASILSPTPAEWIGQLPKVCPVCKGKAKKKCTECHGSAWETPRGRRIRSRLSAEELTLVPDQNDAIDSVGIGLWALGRLAPNRIFSNGIDTV